MFVVIPDCSSVETFYWRCASGSATNIFVARFKATECRCPLRTGVGLRNLSLFSLIQANAPIVVEKLSLRKFSGRCTTMKSPTTNKN
ncbi:uncharacterized protein PHALS_06988 [Plasmopara halstedii]|uniref:Uncharacterized protein n=1 Tax=Plasmopara halstedii TaxID=4781 RepID=A0A0P1B5F3_PLAHL|nr:uncharacterized protein PHALS_06988 [Plasmopara halstedii]CEG49215.1 hypothetical protein PHALS_06988 [Plasmopara halstedii]|eukprot:XP_024585584.1 hypothetical protein PHALS_06988 [Plasmopara halstedii]